MGITGYVLLIAGAILLYLSLAGGWRYKTNESGIRISVACIPVYRVLYKDVLFAETLPARSVFSWANYGKFEDKPCLMLSRVWGEAVSIRLKNRMWKSVILTPKDAGAFLEEINIHLKAEEA